MLTPPILPGPSALANVTVPSRFEGKVLTANFGSSDIGATDTGSDDLGIRLNDNSQVGVGRLSLDAASIIRP